MRLKYIFLVGMMILGLTQANTLCTQNCVSFQVGSGTGCQWMCNYCAQHLGTNNYYFTDGVS